MINGDVTDVSNHFMVIQCDSFHVHLLEKIIGIPFPQNWTLWLTRLTKGCGKYIELVRWIYEPSTRESMGKSKPKTKGFTYRETRGTHVSIWPENHRIVQLCIHVFKRWGSKFEGNSQLRPAASESLRAQGLYIAVVPFLAFTGGKPGTCSCGYLRKCWETPFHLTEFGRSCSTWIDGHQWWHHPYSWTNPYMSNVGKPIINHPFGNGLYNLFLVMTGGWFIIVLPTLLVLHVLVHQQKYGHKSIPLHSTPRPHMRSWNCHTSPNLVATHRSCSWRLHVVWRSSLVIRRNQHTHTHIYIYIYIYVQKLILWWTQIPKRDATTQR